MDELENTSDSNPSNLDEHIIHSAAGDIHLPGAKIPFNLQINFSQNNPIQMDTSSPGYGVSQINSGINVNNNPGFFKTFKAEAYEWNASAELTHWAYEHHQEPNPYLDDIAPEGWTPQSKPEMFYDIKPEYLSYLNDARGPKDLQYRHDRVMSEQQQDENLANGSILARILGGIAGIATDPITYIPIANGVKYGKMATTFLKGMQKAFPGVAAIGTYQAGAKELDKVNGNLHDFVINSFVNTVFGTAIFGGLKAGALALDKMELWNLRKIAKDGLDGIDFKFELGEKNEVKGIKAFDTTGGDLSAAKVSQAQEIANASFLKGGLFKIPYVGEGFLKLQGAPIIGSPLVAMVNSWSSIERAFIDRMADHSFWRKGVEKNEASPKSFEHKMKQEFADLRSISAQLNALHLERMGYDIKPSKIGDVRYAAQATYSKSLKAISQNSEKHGWIPRDQFDDEVQQALITGESSEHAAVNDAYAIIRPKLDNLIKNYNDAYGRKTVLTPKMASEFLMRVYDIDYLNTNKKQFVNVISNYFKEADQFISQRMEPINQLKEEIQNLTAQHEKLIRLPKVSDKQIKESSNLLQKKKIDLKVTQEQLQNELRDNEDLKYHVEDWHALSADEAKELQTITKPLNNLKKEAAKQKKILTALKSAKSKSKTSAEKSKTATTAKKHVMSEEEHNKAIKVEDDKLSELNNKIQDEEYNLYEKARSGQINERLYYPETHQLKDPNYRLKFRDVYESDIDRVNYAKAALDSIMHTNPEDTIADIMGKVMGNSKENHLKSRTLMVPDKLLYENNFMTKNLMSKINNYALYVSRRTHIKNVFKDVTPNGGIEPILEKLNAEYKSITEELGQLKYNNDQKLKSSNDAEEINKIKKQNKSIVKKLNNATKRFNRSKLRMNMAYERAMGLRKRENSEIVAQGIIRALTAITNLHQVPITQIADLGSIGLQHGVWPFIRDTVYPAITSINGLIKTKDSEAIREAAAHVHLGLQDVLNGHADKNISLETQPYVNMGPWISGVEKIAHFSSNMDLTTYVDNWLQRWSAATIQSNFMKNLDKYVKGTITQKEKDYLLHYGIDPEKWAERMVKAFKDSKGFKTKLGGYQSRFWQWQDLEAANEFSSAVFRGVQNTIVQRGMFDSPFWADNLLGMLFHTFTGWGYASVNRYLIPLLQRPDSEKILGVLLSLGFGSMVSPLRRMERGEDAYPDNMTDTQRFYEVIADSNVSSAMANTLSWANFLSQERLIGDLKNDKYKNRVGVAASSPVFSTANNLYKVISSLASDEINTKDLKQAAYMLPLSGTLYGRQISDIILNNSTFAPTRQAAHAEKGE